MIEAFRLSIDKRIDKKGETLEGSWIIGLGAIPLFLSTIYNIFNPVSNETWLLFWKYWVWILLVLSFVITTWLIFGGIRNLIDMFKLLKSRTVDLGDDGWVDRSGDSEE